MNKANPYAKNTQKIGYLSVFPYRKQPDRHED